MPHRAGAGGRRGPRHAAPSAASCPTVGEADRTLRAGPAATTADVLADLDVARWRPEVADELMDLRHRPPTSTLPPGVPPRARRPGRARPPGAATIVDLALEDDGGARHRRRVGAAPAAPWRRSTALRDAALVAACSPEAWPTG